MDFCEEVVNWLGDLINWLNDVASWLNSINWFGWANWAINDINSAINDLQWAQQWVSENCEEIDEIENIISWAIQIIGWVETIISLF